MSSQATALQWRGLLGFIAAHSLSARWSQSYRNCTKTWEHVWSQGERWITKRYVYTWSPTRFSCLYSERSILVFQTLKILTCNVFSDSTGVPHQQRRAHPSLAGGSAVPLHHGQTLLLLHPHRSHLCCRGSGSSHRRLSSEMHVGHQIFSVHWHEAVNGQSIVCLIILIKAFSGWLCTCVTVFAIWFLPCMCETYFQRNYYPIYLFKLYLLYLFIEIHWFFKIFISIYFFIQNYIMLIINNHQCFINDITVFCNGYGSFQRKQSQ